VKSLLKNIELEAKVKKLEASMISTEIESPDAFSEIVTRSSSIKQIFRYIEAIKETTEPILITGETGTGKELFAKAVHSTSGRKGKFIAVNVAGLDNELFSDTMFGHEKGGFTGAEKMRTGLIEQAAGGTIFLDEIGDLRGESQVKLLRLLQEREFYQIGSDSKRSADVKIVTATNLSLDELGSSEKFRKDLFFRLSTHHIELLPLRERKNDIPILTDHFIAEAETIFRKKFRAIPPSAYTSLFSYSFPGNIRELRSIIFDIVGKTSGSDISPELIKNRIFRKNSAPEASIMINEKDMEVFLSVVETLPSLRETEKMLINESLKRSKNNQTTAARLIGLSQQTLSYRLKPKKKRS